MKQIGETLTKVKLRKGVHVFSVHCIIFVPAAFLSVSLKLFLKSTFIPYLSDPRNSQVVWAL